MGQVGLRVASLGSGSCGNAFIITTETTTILVDCGVGRAEIERGLHALDRSLGDIQAILISHEHHDHIRGLGRLGRALPVVCTRGTGRASRLLRGHWSEMRPGSLRQIGDLDVMMLAVSHDAAEPCGYSLSQGANRVTILTDLGCWSESLNEPVAASNLIVLEANHDECMLQAGPYPPLLKERITSERGHLSNAQCGAALASTVDSFTSCATIWLAHLSQTNNSPAIAQASVSTALRERNVKVVTLPRRAMGPVWSSIAPIVENSQLELALSL